MKNTLAVQFQKKNSKSGKIIWAIDPFLEENHILRSAAYCIKAMAELNPSLEIEPVYVWGDAPISPWMPPIDFLKVLKKDAQELLAKVLVNVKLSGVQPLRILSKPGCSMSEMARELVAHAKQRGASMILVPSHGRTGLKRIFLGSFADTLTLHSDVPVMIVHPNLKKPPELKEIFFPTDFSKESKAAFSQVIDFALTHGSQITIFHQVAEIVYPNFSSAFSSDDTLASAVAENQSACEALAKRWALEANQRGVRAQWIVSRSLKGSSVSETILKQAKKRKAIIAMASRSGPVTTVLLGSTTRQVVRGSERPVWILHP